MSLLKKLAGRFAHRPLILAAIGSLILAGGASAYFLAHGSANGIGNASVGNAPSAAITISHATLAGDPLVPGGPSQTLTYQVTSDKIMKGVHAYAMWGNSNSLPAGCDKNWFTFTPSPDTFDLAPGVATPVTVSVALGESNTDQSPCEGFSPNVILTAIG